MTCSRDDDTAQGNTPFLTDYAGTSITFTGLTGEINTLLPSTR